MNEQYQLSVTLHTEGVDWNNKNTTYSARLAYVTLHTEGVDWNSLSESELNFNENVTLHTEGVDWNICLIKLWTNGSSSPSTRRVWIEILR